MFSYATASDLCNLDSVNRQFNELTTEAAAAQWKILTYERFGMRNGKDDWKLGVSFLREPIFFKLDTAMNNPHGANLLRHTILSLQLLLTTMGCSTIEDMSQRT
jgi:hypothetical protein